MLIIWNVFLSQIHCSRQGQGRFHLPEASSAAGQTWSNTVQWGGGGAGTGALGGATHRTWTSRHTSRGIIPISEEVCALLLFSPGLFFGTSISILLRCVPSMVITYLNFGGLPTIEKTCLPSVCHWTDPQMCSWTDPQVCSWTVPPPHV